MKIDAAPKYEIPKYEIDEPLDATRRGPLGAKDGHNVRARSVDKSLILTDAPETMPVTETLAVTDTIAATERLIAAETVVAQGNLPAASSPDTVTWPKRVDLFGLPVTAAACDESAAAVIAAARLGVSAVVSCHSVHAIVTASGDPQLRRIVQTFDMVTPDGQPVRWALNLLYGAKLKEPVTGRALTWAVCDLAAEEGVPIYLYGSTPEVIDALEGNLLRQFPGIKIAGAESPPFRPLSAAEDDELVRRINASGARIVFVGLGCPKQDTFAFEHRDRIAAVQVCVGAVFDFYAGHKNVAPAWMQRHGLEWLFRLIQEPRRLWRRYLTTNSIFLFKLAAALVRRNRNAADTARGAP